MSDIQLTVAADKVLCVIYKEYLSRLKNGSSKSNAIIFEDAVVNRLFSKDISFELKELKNYDLVEVWISGDFELTSKGIVYMENRFQNNLKKITDFISKFIP